jgi:hypothetical protein
MKEEILVLDIEATDVNKKVALLLELGAVVLNTKTGDIREVFSATFKDPKLTRKHSKAWIFDNSDMTVEEIRNSKPITDYQDEIQAIFTEFSGRITAWNRPYDSGVLERYGFDLGEEMGDPMRISTPHFGLLNKGGRPKWPKVIEAYPIIMGVEKYDEAHRGLQDAKDEAAIIYELIKLGVYNG